ncbi:RibD family protein, partial [Lysobacter sp. 2RAB21]
NELQLEAGASLGGAFLDQGLVDEVLVYVAPVLLGENARPLFDGLGIEAMTHKLQLDVIDVRRLGEDTRVLLQPRR